MRVAILADFPLFVIPGCEERFHRPGHYATWLPMLVRGFEKMTDLEVHWIVISRLVNTTERLRWMNQTFHILPTFGKGCRATTLYTKDIRGITDCLDFIDPDLVHGWGTEDVYALAAVRSGRINIVSMQGILSYYVLRNRMHPRVYLQALMEIYILHKATCVTVESAWGRNVILHRSPHACVELVEYGVNELFCNVQWQPDPQRPAAIFVGSVIPRKGIHDAVAAFADPALSGAELWVVGEGPLAAELRVKATPNVKWIGRLPQQDIVKLLSKAWCLVLPTRADTSPNIVKEARMVGLPVISTPHGGQTSYIRNQQNGYLVEVNDIGGLVETLKLLLLDVDQCTKMGQAFLQEDRAALDPMLTVQKFHELYCNLVKSTE